MDLRLRQICLIAGNLDATVAELGAVLDLRPVHGSGDLSAYGLPERGPMSEGGRKLLTEQGIQNLVFGAGTDFLEVLFPLREDATAARFMQRRGGDTGYMIILQADDVARFADLARLENVRIVHEARFAAYEDIHLHVKDTGGALLSIARHLPSNEPDGPWYPAGVAWQTMPASRDVLALTAAEIQSPDPVRLAERWGRLLGVAPQGDDARLTLTLKLDDGELRFVEATDGRGEGFSGFDVRVADRSRVLRLAKDRGLQTGDGTVTVCGMRVGLVD